MTIWYRNFLKNSEAVFPVGSVIYFLVPVSRMNSVIHKLGLFCLYKAPLKTNTTFHRAALKDLQTFAQPCSVLLSSAQFRVVKRTKHFGQHFFNFVDAYAVLHKELKQDNAMWKLCMRDFNDPSNYSPRRNVERCLVKCCIRLTGA